MLHTRNPLLPYKIVFTSLLILSSLNYSLLVKTNSDNILSHSAELFIAGVIGGSCMAAATTLWNIIAQPSHIELSNMEEKKQIFEAKQKSLMVSQDALTKIAIILQQVGPHLPTEEREALEKKLTNASQQLQKAGLKFTNKYRPEYQEYVQNL